MAVTLQYHIEAGAVSFFGAVVFTIIAGSLLWLSAIYALYQILLV